MKIISRTPDFLWKIFFAFIISLCVFEVLFEIPMLRRSISDEFAHTRNENYDPSLGRLNSLDALESYIDSLYKSERYDKSDPSTYPKLVDQVVSKRFYHGYSTYSLGNNFIASFSGAVTGKSLDAIVLPDDLLEFKYADCRQQSIVMLDLLAKKNYIYRPVSFKAEGYGEHFAFEVFYNGKWHFFDPNMEPDAAYLNNSGRPGIREIASSEMTLMAIYPHFDQELVKNLFKKYSYGQTNQVVPVKMSFFQNTTNFLSITAWIFLILLYVIILRKFSIVNAINFRFPLQLRNWRTAY